VAGEQLWLYLAVDDNRRWKLITARESQVCPRGATGALCN